MHPHFKDGPSVEDFAKLLCECRKDRNRFRALSLYGCICINGFECDTALGNSLVPLLVKVGCMRDALYVFDRLAIRNELSWNFLLSGYNNCDQPQKTLDLYKMMRNDDASSSSSSHPNVHTFVALLKACTKLRDTRTSLSVHVECDSGGFLHQDISLATTLIDTYAKCGSMEKARQVFDKLHVRDTISWTSLIVGYVENGKPEEAMGCFKKMQADRIVPDRVTFVSIFKACGSSDSVLEFEAMHCEVERRGFLQGNLELGSSLINLYDKCGSLNKAQEVFDRFAVRDVVLWTSLIAGYVERSNGKESIQCIEQMRSEGIIPDSVVSVLSLNACNNLGAIERGKEVHAVLESDDMLGVEANITTALVDMYMKCGLVRKAQEVFDRVQVHDAATWTALIMGYTENGCSKEALTCFEQMRFEGVSPDAIAVVCGLKACGDAVSMDKGEELHRLVEESGSLTEESIVRSALVDMYAKFGLVSESRENFDRLAVRDAIAWNALIGGYVGGGGCGRVLESFDEMKLNCVLPDSLTYISSLKACGCMGAVEKGRRIHGEIIEQGWLLRIDAALGASLIDMYGKCGSIQEARGAFDQLPAKDATSWGALLALYVEWGHGEEAMECFERMRSEDMPPDEGTFAHILKACGSVGAIGKGQEIHAEIERFGLLMGTSLFLGTSLVDMYAKCGFPSLAWNAFERIQYRDLITWTVLMSAYSHVGEARSVFRLFDRMVGEGVKPSAVTFVIVLDACRRTGLSHRGQMYFEAMGRDFGIVPIPKHHTAMIDRMCCAGELSDAVMMTMMAMSDDPSSASVWRTVLSSCRSIGNLELAERAFERAICVDRSDAAAYVLMSHIYAGS